MRLIRFIPALSVAILILAGVRVHAAPPADDKVRAVVDERVKDWWPKAEEKRFDQIGWAPNILTARKLAAENDRPLFLFTMDGRVNLGRC